MKALVLREARRLAPYGLAPALVAGAAGLADAYSAPVQALGSIGAAALVGVAAFVPDTARGGALFLRTLPVSSWRVAAVKIAVAAAWSLVASAPFLAPMWTTEPFVAALSAALGLSAGLLASVVVHRVMPALLVAPVLALATFLLAAVVPSLALGMIYTSLPMFVLPPMVAVFIVLAATAFAHGDLHRPSARPALIAAAGLAPAFLLNFAATAGAKAWTDAHVLPGALRVKHATPVPGGPRLALDLQADLWTGRERRVALVEADRAWLLPLPGVVAEASPDGRFLLLDDTRVAGGWVVDTGARTWTWIAGDSGAPRGLGYADAVWGQHGLEQLVRGRTSIEALDGAGRRASRPLPPGARYVGLHDDQALLVDARGLLSCALPRRGELAGEPARVLEWSEGVTCDEVVVAPGARALARDAAGVVRVLDLRTAHVVATLDLDPARRLQLDRAHVTFSPDGRCAALTHGDEGVSVVDLSTGERLLTTPAPLRDGREPWLGYPPAWSPDGRAVAMPWGPVAFLGDHPQGGAACMEQAAHLHAPFGGDDAMVVGFVLDRAVLRGEAPSLARLFAAEAPLLLSLDGGVR